ncbi:MAG: HAD family phosphatase [Bacteroidales bacterium]|nr:HAD family phosphatase [Bacteroidales bacterium]
MYDLVIFDMDGLMLDTEAKWAQAWEDVGRKYSHDFGIERFRELVGISGQPVYDKVASWVNHDPKKYIDEAHELGLQYINEQGIDPKVGLFELLDYLERNQIKKAVATTTRKAMAHKHLQDIGILDKFDFIICGDEVKNRKPDPEIYLRVIAKMAITKTQTLILEDSYHGVQGAYNAQIDCIMVPDLLEPGPEQKQQTVAILKSLSNVIEFLKEG